MMDVVSVISMVTVRVLFLSLYTGLYIWLAAAYLSGVRLLPPPQRLILTREVTRKILQFSWIFLVLAIIGGLGTAYLLEPELVQQASSGVSGTLSMISTFRGLILGSELLVTLLLIVVNGVLQFYQLPKMYRIGARKIEPGTKGLTWYLVDDVRSVNSSMKGLIALSILNAVIGALTIALGVLYSNIPA